MFNVLKQKVDSYTLVQLVNGSSVQRSKNQTEEQIGPQLVQTKFSKLSVVFLVKLKIH